MGILNATPDSFSDGGKHLAREAGLAAALEMIESGADILDVGGESTRPGADPVGAAEEADRVLPLIEEVRRRSPAPISIDTTKAEVARQALDAGADLVNDVSAFGDPGMLPLLRERDAPAVIMHMRGSPRTMQSDTGYDDVTAEVSSFLADRLAEASAADVSNDKIVVDPGIGFGKSTAGNLEILRELPRLGRLERPILVGASRKNFIGKILDVPVDERLEGSLAVAAFASAQGAHVIRAHDVKSTVRVVRMIDALRAR
ncbi:MAG: dihydropteroate synthase [bacterium]|nr:dihydropteroate synthase [bacterium]